MDCGIILANGTGTRFNSSLPKQFCKINDQAVINYSINSLLQSKKIKRIIVVADLKYQPLLPNDEIIDCIAGGSTRNKSLKAALVHIKNNYNCEHVIILEAARPLVESDTIDEYIGLLEKDWDAVITGQIITDSLGAYDQSTVDRENYYLIQAPEAFDFDLLYNNFDECSPITATNQQLPMDSKVFINFNFKDNYKITYPGDLQIIEYYMRARDGL